MNTTKISLLSAAVCGMFMVGGMAEALQPDEINYDESKVPDYTLPDPLMMEDGRRVTDAEQWRTQRRPEILRLFQTHVYGKSPGRPDDLRFEVFDHHQALEGEAVRKQVTVYFSPEDDGPSMDVLIYLPADAEGPVPIFLGLNFFGNHTIHDDPEIRLSERWMRSNPNIGIENNRATQQSRGASSSRWPVETILSRGYGLATIYCGDLVPDHSEGIASGVPPLFYKEGQTQPKPDEWGAIGAWAWGLSRAVDYFETDDDVDHTRVAVMGHSRLGKTALWAGAQDERFALTISNNSGCGGAALSRRRFGETVARINQSFPHWFCDNFDKYNNNEDELPVDQHMLIALMAPRAVYVASAEEDRWADPKGEFLAARHAHEVYELLGVPGIASKEMPGMNEPLLEGRIGYHIRTGGHAVTDYDWQQYLDFADRHMR